MGDFINDWKGVRFTVIYLGIIIMAQTRQIHTIIGIIQNYFRSPRQCDKTRKKKKCQNWTQIISSCFTCI